MSTITAKVDFSPRMQIELPLTNINGTNIQVDWGDGSQIETFADGIGNATHSYTNNQNHDYKYEIIITGDITGLGDSAFRSNYYVEVKLPEGITTIGNACFRESRVEQLTIPKTVTRIGDQFNYGNTALKTLTINGNSLTTIGTDFCFGASSLATLKLPDSITNMGVRAFSSCTSLKSFTVPKNLTGFSTFFLQNASLDLIRFKNTTPIGLPSGANATTIIGVPKSALATYRNTNGFPSDISRYKVYGESIAEKLIIVGETMANNLTEKGVNATYTDGLTTLAEKILQVPTEDFVTKTVAVQVNGETAPRIPVILYIGNTIIDCAILPDDATTVATATNYYRFTYSIKVPQYDDGNTISYTWTIPNPPKGYNMGGSNSSYILNEIVEVETIDETPLG